MPAPWRLRFRCVCVGIVKVSISDEMPAPWRRYNDATIAAHIAGFQSQMRCQPPGDAPAEQADGRTDKFQSQMRCQPPGDPIRSPYSAPEDPVSISDEMPAPWRPLLKSGVAGPGVTVSISDEMPAPWRRITLQRWEPRSIRVSISDEMPAPWRRLGAWS